MNSLLKIIAVFVIAIFTVNCTGKSVKDNKSIPANFGKQSWIEKPQNEWPMITMINHIKYLDTEYQVAGCGFLLDTGTDTIAVTAKHILAYFKSNTMNSVSFTNSLKEWEMYPKDNISEKVYVEKIINENTSESIQNLPVDRDWLLLSIRQKSKKNQPLQFRKSPLTTGEKVYIIGWRYNDNNCTQRIYAGKLEKISGGSLYISTIALANNTVPGLSGSPVIDSKGYLIGIMSQKYGKMELISSTRYPGDFLSNNKTH